MGRIMAANNQDPFPYAHICTELLFPPSEQFREIFNKMLAATRRVLYKTVLAVCVAYYTITGKKGVQVDSIFLLSIILFLEPSSRVGGVLMLAASDSNEPAKHQRV